MTIALVVVLAVAVLLWHQNRVLQRLSLVADLALENRAIEAGRLKSAETRIKLYDRENRHMCLTPSCQNPVIGKWIFAHCEQHLERHEKRWLEDKLESLDGNNLPVYSEDPTAKQIQKAIEERDKELAQQNASNKMQALAEARDRVRKDRLHELERDAYVPRKLHARIEQTEKDQQAAVGGSWVPLNLVEWIQQESEKNK